MFTCFLIFAIGVALCMRFPKEKWYAEYLSKESCASIKGVCICYILLCHSFPYLSKLGYSFPWIGDRLFIEVVSIVAQLCVVMFLFYSGFGVAESVITKGKRYVFSIPKHRILGTILNFDVAVLVFIILDLLIGIRISFYQTLLSFICLESVGNSNWYIFAIILCYMISFLVFSTVRSRIMGAWVLAMAVFAAIVALSYVLPCWWFSTMASFSAGVLYSAYRRTLERVLRKWYWLFIVLLCIVVVVTPNDQAMLHGIVYNVKSVSFAYLVVLLTMRIRIVGSIFKWSGEKLFPLYIYQRVPMIILAHTAPLWLITFNGGLMFVIISATTTAIIASMYNRWAIQL